MKTKIIIYIGCITIIFSIICAAYIYNKNTNNDGEYEYIKRSIETIIKIQYRRADKRILNEISTSDFILNLHDDFYKDFCFYTIDKDFMETYRITTEGNVEISVRVEDFRGSYIQVFTLTRNEDNKYLISKLQYDI